MSRTDLRDGLSLLQMESQAVLELPERAALSLANVNAAIPINAAVALNALSDGSNALAGARQDAPITQALMTN